ncbi:MAG: hydrogenase maturation protease [Legionellales bacterium]|nr:hydrogenase maturation protease [Legionellales bacterium]
MIHIYGIGSPFGADQIGNIVLDGLKQVLDKNSVAIQYDVGSGFQLIEYMQGAKELHIIDAMITGQLPGTLLHFHVNEITPLYNPLLSTHGCHLAEIIELNRILGYLPDKTFLHGVEIDRDNQLTDKLLQSCEMLVQELVQYIFKPN